MFAPKVIKPRERTFGSARPITKSGGEHDPKTVLGASWNFKNIPVSRPDRKMDSFEGMAEMLGLDAESVRIRSDSSAVGFLKTNFAAAAAIDSSTIFVRPEYRTNSEVMSHELVHIAQLRRGVAGSVQDAEGAAHGAAAELRHGESPRNVGNAGPPPLFLHFTGGAFDQALDNAKISDSVIKLLKRSSTFMRTVQVLDQHYVWFHNPKYIGSEDRSGGVITQGVFKGKRTLYIEGGVAKGSFTPFGSLDATIAADIIKIAGGTDDVEIVSSIAHEATHAFHYVTGKPPPANIDASIQAGITEEISTRDTEVKIAREVHLKQSKGRQTIDAQVARGYLSRPLVERDIAPDVGLTYLESSGFDALLSEALIKDGLSDEQAGKVRDSIDKGPKKFPMVRGQHGFDEASKYAFVYVNRKIAIETWREYYKKFPIGNDSAESQREKERLVQENARALLDGRIDYSPLPGS